MAYTALRRCTSSRARLENWAVFDEISGAQLLLNLRAGAKNLTQGWAQGLQGAQKRMRKNSGAQKFSPIKNWRFQGRKNLYLAKNRGSHCPIFQSGSRAVYTINPSSVFNSNIHFLVISSLIPLLLFR